MLRQRQLSFEVLYLCSEDLFGLARGSQLLLQPVNFSIEARSLRPL